MAKKKIFALYCDSERLYLVLFGIKISFNIKTKVKEKEFREILKKKSENFWPNQSLSNQKNYKKIYVIGDSHNYFFTGEEYIDLIPFKQDIKKRPSLISCFEPFHLGSTLAYNAMNPNSGEKGFQKTNWLIEKKLIPQNSIILLCFGEIDIRCHVIKQAKLHNKPIEKIVDNILSRYLGYIKCLQEKGFKIITWGPIPSQKEEWILNQFYPRVGTEIERNIATKLFNEKLNKLAIENNFINCSIYDKLVDSDNLTLAEYIADECHLSQRALEFMIEEFCKKGVLKMAQGKVIVNYDLEAANTIESFEKILV